MINIQFMIGSCKHADLWVEDQKINKAISKLLETYAPLLEKQNYCITLFRRTDNILSTDAGE